MSLAFAFLLSFTQSQASDLLDQAVAQPGEIIRSQITTKGTYLGDSYEFVDEFKTDQMGKRKTSLSPLGVLISQGVSVVPYLISQLTRTEPTKLTIEAIPYEFYDPKRRQIDTEAWDVVTADHVAKTPPAKHTITRGDIAFFALGQILNRWYGILHEGKPTLYCSASDHPEIQKQATEDWGKLNHDQLENSLAEDVKHPDSYGRMVFGFSRLRNASSEAAIEAGVAALRLSYGRFPIGKPDPFPRTLFTEFQVVGDSRLDQPCHQILNKTDKENGFLDEYDTTKYQIILYLRTRDRYMPLCLNYATEAVKKKQDKYGYFAQFLRRYGQRKKA
jgi:hypothetical protein